MTSPKSLEPGQNHHLPGCTHKLPQHNHCDEELSPYAWVNEIETSFATSTYIMMHKKSTFSAVSCWRSQSCISYVCKHSHPLLQSGSQGCASPGRQLVSWSQSSEAPSAHHMIHRNEQKNLHNMCHIALSTRTSRDFPIIDFGDPPLPPPLKKWQNSLLDFYSQPLWTTPVVLC